MLRPGLRLDGDRLLDPPLQRAIRLGDRDKRLIAALLQRPRTFADIQQIAGDDAQARLTALARLYLLVGPRSDARVTLQTERALLAPPTPDVPLRWPEGLRPPQHGCVGTGTCCSASFLGPIHPAEAAQMTTLAFGRERRFAPGAPRFEIAQFRGKEVRGMARDAAGQCVAQGDDGLCEIHLAHGPQAKPLTCRQFPLRLHQSPDGVHVSLLLACDGYDRSREAAVPWPERAAEIRALLADGAVALAVHLPVMLAAGLPIRWTDWQALRAQFLAAEPPTSDPSLWLERVLALAETAAQQRQVALAEGPDIAWSTDLRLLRTALRAPAGLWLASVRMQAEADLRAAVATQAHPRDRQRLQQLADGIAALESPLPLTEQAQQHLHDIVTNDLQVQVILGELDAGLGNLTRRLLLARGVAAALAQEAGKAAIDGRDTTQALHVVYRSEAELTWLGTLHSAAGQVAHASPVP